ncbi:MAG: PKD domain-containing protein, partial [Flavobacteriales bacterium]|nr:PKD domain-containing protein [Flavobacteriales bacterium]
MQKILITLFTVCLPWIASATHIVGGELYYTYLGNNQYLITLKVYRDCGPANVNGTGFDDEASVGIFYSSGAMHMNLGMDLFNAEVNFVPVQLENPCFILPPDVCVEEAVYEDIVNLPPTNGGYDLVYQRCCRNPSIINIINPQDAGATFYTHIPGPDELTGNNSCPVFQSFPPVALCTNAEFFFDHGAVDPDGDDLVYSFCTPKHGASPDFPAPTPPDPPPFANVTWAAGYSAAYPIDSNPAFTIDPATGYITGTPTQPGQYVIGVCVSEYRNGVLINSISRDFQFNVTICDPNIIAAIPEQTQLCNGLTFDFTNTSVNAQDFLWDFGDPATDQDFSTDPSPTYTYSDTGTYVVTLIANPGWPCADTATQIYQAFPLVEPDIIGPDFECLNGVPTYSFHAGGSYQDEAEFQWTFPAGSSVTSSTAENPPGIELPGEGGYQVSLTIVENTCEGEATIDVEVPPDPQAIITPQELFCDGLTFQFVNNSQNATTYYWDFGVPWLGEDFSEEFEPEYTYGDTGVYTVTLTAFADLTCPDEISADFSIYTLLDPYFPPNDPQCFEGNAFSFEAMGTEDSQAQYLWNFGEMAAPGLSTSANPSNIQFSEPGTFPVELTISENGCVKSYEDEVQVIPNPEFAFFQDFQAGCPPFYAHFVDSSMAETTIFYSWDFGDGSTSTQAEPTHIYHSPGTYDVSVTAYTLSGCVEEETFNFNDIVLVYTPPIADLDVEPQQVDILQADVYITNESLGSIDCQYYMSDGGSMEECDGWYSFSDGGAFEILQIVTDIHGCQDTAKSTVLVNGHTLYIPNSFTPNNDGINDVFLPIALGVSSFHMTIYDRWGTVIFESFDRDTPWVGDVRGGDHFAQDGQYIYHVVIEDQLKYPYEYTGHV